MSVRTTTARNILESKLKQAEETLERQTSELEDAQESVDTLTKDIAYQKQFIADLREDLGKEAAT